MAKKMTKKVLRVGFWWPTIFKDAHQLVKKCEACQKVTRKLRFSSMLALRPVSTPAPFDQWGIDIIGEMAIKSSGGNSWMLVSTNYITKWVEAIPTKKDTSKVVIDFLMKNILSQFGTPKRIVTNNAMCFRFNEFMKFCNVHYINVSY